MKRIIRFFTDNRLAFIFIIGFLIASLLILTRDPVLFDDPYSTVLYDRNGNLLGARIAGDEQWRFPRVNKIPAKFEKCILTFEDTDFYYHSGVNPLSLIRAFLQNIRAGEVVSGGSTITMQVIRLSRKGKSRTICEKVLEIFLALHLEIHYSKEDILKLYASHAPFGGNVVGLDAASWRYYNRSADNLSWAEASTIAVLPNAPSLIHPGRNRDILRSKRDRLLVRLFENGIIDSVSYRLALLEEIPLKPSPLPGYAPHLLDEIVLKNEQEEFTSTIKLDIQKKVNEIVKDHYHILKSNQVYNIAVIVAGVESGDVLAYVGNTRAESNDVHANSVDICVAPRSTGSIMKPYLYAAMLDAGEILQNTLIPDIPTFIGGYSPKNFNLQYQGMVPAKQALSRSLNIPAVRMLHNFGLERFHLLLQDLGLQSINKPADYYGLTLILGGAEASLWELTGVYASMSRTLKHFRRYHSKYFREDFRPLNFDATVRPETPEYEQLNEQTVLTAGAVWLTYEALREVNRPEEEAGWQNFTSSGKIAWKTGTSFGFRDAWAIGTSSEYVVGVWAGNADGEGRPGLTGRNAAAPVMFDVFRLLPKGTWFDKPFDELVQTVVCNRSGNKAGKFCKETDTAWILKSGLNSPLCSYHQKIYLDSTGNYRVHRNCEEMYNMKADTFFVLPPIQEWYYRKKNHDYISLPPYRKDCLGQVESKKLDIVYPEQGNKIYLPTEIDGSPGKMVAMLAVRDPATKVFWHLDNEYAGTTVYFHQMEFRPELGVHVLTVVDKTGTEAIVKFEIVN